MLKATQYGSSHFLLKQAACLLQAHRSPDSMMRPDYQCSDGASARDIECMTSILEQVPQHKTCGVKEKSLSLLLNHQMVYTLAYISQDSLCAKCPCQGHLVDMS